MKIAENDLGNAVRGESVLKIEEIRLLLLRGATLIKLG